MILEAFLLTVIGISAVLGILAWVDHVWHRTELHANDWKGEGNSR